MVYDVLVHFVDGSEKKISGVTTYTLKSEVKAFLVEKNGYVIMIPVDNVLYIGRFFDLKD